MPEEPITITTTRSWGDRIKNAFASALIGLFLCAGGPWLLWWNEGRSVNRASDLREVGAGLVSIDPGSIDLAHENKPVHTHGVFKVESPATDPETGFSINAARLKRIVEMFQWEERTKQETKDKLGGGQEIRTTYTYERGWKADIIRSEEFQDKSKQNPSSMPLEGETFTSENVTLGAFKLDPPITSRIAGWEPVRPTDDVVALVSKRLSTPDKPCAASGGWIYCGKDPAMPQIGDLRMKFEAVIPKEISIIARQTGGTLAPHTTARGGDVTLVATGLKTSAEMIAQAMEDNRSLAWLLRAAGALALFIGFSLLAAPLAAIAAVVPFLGRAVGFLTGTAALLASVGISTVIIGVAWIAHRPFLAIPVVVGGIALIIWGATRRRAPAPASALPPGHIPAP